MTRHSADIAVVAVEAWEAIRESVSAQSVHIFQPGRPILLTDNDFLVFPYEREAGEVCSEAQRSFEGRGVTHELQPHHQRKKSKIP